MMQKDFDAWNTEKKNIHNYQSYPFFKERDIQWCSLGTNVGFEQDGDSHEHQRPVLILKGLSANTCFAIPLTSSTSKHPLRIPLGMIDGTDATQ